MAFNKYVKAIPILHYFNLYAKGEPVRKALWKAGIEYTDHPITFEEWPTFKVLEKLPYGQLPVLELPDGTTIA